MSTIRNWFVLPSHGWCGARCDGSGVVVDRCRQLPEDTDPPLFDCPACRVAFKGEPRVDLVRPLVDLNAAAEDALRDVRAFTEGNQRKRRAVGRHLDDLETILRGLRAALELAEKHIDDTARERREWVDSPKASIAFLDDGGGGE